MNHLEYSSRERRVLARLRTPEKIQRYLDDGIGYNKERHGETCYSPRMVLRHGIAHCMEGALFAAAALEYHGHPALLMDLEAERDDDHVIAIFREHGHWGGIAKSNYSGLRFRCPIYRTLRELALSYFEHYYNLKGEKTLRTYSRPVRLARFDCIGWRTREMDVWEIPEYLLSIAHTPLLLSGSRRRYWMDTRLYKAGMVGRVK